MPLAIIVVTQVPNDYAKMIGADASRDRISYSTSCHRFSVCIHTQLGIGVMRRDLFAKAAPMMVLLFASNCSAQFTAAHVYRAVCVDVTNDRWRPVRLRLANGTTDR